MIHRCMAVRIQQSMTQLGDALHDADSGDAARAYGDNTPQPVRSLREWGEQPPTREQRGVA